jgi:hypothetical protein
MDSAHRMINAGGKFGSTVSAEKARIVRPQYQTKVDPASTMS